MRLIAVAASAALVLSIAALFVLHPEMQADPDGPRSCRFAGGETPLVFVPGGTFAMGTDDGLPEEGPARRVTVDGFWIDVHEVTNAAFARFVAATGHVTVAERVPDYSGYPGVPPEKIVPGSAVFVPPADLSRGLDLLSWWRFVPGANWRHPEGPGSTIEGRENFPVVHIAYEDALAYARWAGRELPTEEQWEYAARGGLEGKTYAWGDDLYPGGKQMANTWQGLFPVQNSADDGYVGLAPVGCFLPNGYGLYDMIGNVWEWTSTVYAPANPGSWVFEHSREPFRIIKGGSFLCAPNYCMRYRPAASQAGESGLGTSHIGFRTVLNRPENRS